MKFTPIYQRVLALWPDEIDISDGYEPLPKNEATPGTTPNGGKGYFFPTLSKAWDDAEDAIDPKKDGWGDMMVWTMYQAFHTEARRLLEKEGACLTPKNIPMSTLENRYRENLNTEGWEELRDNYEGL